VKKKTKAAAPKLSAATLAKLAAQPANDLEPPCGRWLVRPIVALSLDVHTESLTNRAGHEHPFATAKLVKAQRERATWEVIRRRDDFEGLELPLTFVLVRVAPGVLDDGNLGGAFKAVQDGLTDGLGRVMPKGTAPRNDRDGLRWVYGQRKPREGERQHTEIRVYRSGDAARALLRLVPTEPSPIEEVLRAFTVELDALLVREVG
jgi:hypothetical protein